MLITGTTMRFVLPLFFLILCAMPISSYAQGGISASITAVKANPKAKPQFIVNSHKKAANIAKARLGGKVLKVSTKKSAYRVKLIKADGHIVTVSVDRKTGKITGGN